MALVATAMLSLTATSEAAVILAINARRQRVVNVVQVQRVRQVAVVQQLVVSPLAVFQPVQSVSFVPFVQAQVFAPVYGQYQAQPAQLRAPERITEKVDPTTGRVIERIIER